MMLKSHNRDRKDTRRYDGMTSKKGALTLLPPQIRQKGGQQAPPRPASSYGLTWCIERMKDCI